MALTEVNFDNLMRAFAGCVQLILKQEMAAVEHQIDHETARVVKAVNGLIYAHDGLTEMISYCDDYFIDKWELSSYVMKVREILHELGVPANAYIG